MIPFVVFSLPRSRSAWLSVVLSASGRLVGHDLGIECDTPEQFVNELNIRGGTCETGAAFAWRELRRLVPKARFVVILRNPEDVIKSLLNQGLVNVQDEIYERHRQLLELSRQPDVLCYNFDDLTNLDNVCNIYRYCTDQVPPVVWIDKLMSMNIQIDFVARIHRLFEREEKIAELKRLIKDKTGLKIRVEPWSNVFWSQAKVLAEDHFREVDEGVESNRPFDLDEQLMQSVQDSGSLLLLTARLDDELVGYIMWQMAPDLESKGLLIAHQGAWFIKKGHAGSGLKLFDESLEELKKRGIKCVYPHHRMQGRGANLGNFFEQKGAKLTQHTYSLWIGD